MSIMLAISLNAAAATEARPLSFPILKLSPYSFYDKNGNSQGYLFEIFTAILENSGQNEIVKIVPLKRMLKEFKSGFHDCTLIADTPLSKSLFRIIEPIGSKIRGGILPAADKTITTYEMLNSLEIGVPLGVSFHKKFDADSHLKKIETTDYLESVRMLVHDRLDAVAGNIDSFYFNAKKIGYPVASTFGEPLVLTSLDIVLACNEHNPSDELIQKLKMSLLELRENGKIQQIINKYL
ncbi:MAG: transporter substrate-binding domain-containing protein [Pseudomonas marincola]